MNDIAQKAVLAVIAAAIGWAGNALTLDGRVAAIERGQARLEVKMDRLLEQRVSEAKP
jgi:hypothetical protein